MPMFMPLHEIPVSVAEWPICVQWRAILDNSQRDMSAVLRLCNTVHPNDTLNNYAVSLQNVTRKT